MEKHRFKEGDVIRKVKGKLLRTVIKVENSGYVLSNPNKHFPEIWENRFRVDSSFVKASPLEQLL